MELNAPRHSSRTRAFLKRRLNLSAHMSCDACYHVQVRVLQQKLAAMDQPAVVAPLDVCATEAALLGAASSSTLSGPASSAGAYQLGARLAAGMAHIITISVALLVAHQLQVKVETPRRR